MGKSRTAAIHASDLLKSVGVRAYYLDPLHASHGDVGTLREGDVAVLYSKSGRTRELVALAEEVLKPRGVFVYGVCCDGGDANRTQPRAAG